MMRHALFDRVKVLRGQHNSAPGLTVGSISVSLKMITNSLNPSAENWTVRCVSILQQIPTCGVPRKGVRHLVTQPDLRGILGYAEMDDFRRS